MIQFQLRTIRSSANNLLGFHLVFNIEQNLLSNKRAGAFINHYPAVFVIGIRCGIISSARRQQQN
ncbi:hypothetical protein K649_07910 [Meiothermus ruber DSM 1279]|uniref:Uncharacterized protein n=1 Tax=Meiothermus ruber (strain ATCC 35948 / DSM 1279 / VKM B-1258 / 21) TaxID=504728 RepID=M9X6H5_MEIRD|nr:hypothetical protein K649_07910 [Meiothermus ruber DSM 1279]